MKCEGLAFKSVGKIYFSGRICAIALQHDYPLEKTREPSTAAHEKAPPLTGSSDFAVLLMNGRLLSLFLTRRQDEYSSLVRLLPAQPARCIHQN